MTTPSGQAQRQADEQRDPGLSRIMSERRQLLNLAYRMLGSLADAEDVVQETYTRWYAMSRAQQEAVESPGAWLTKVASRICLTLLGSARTRRETYVGEWIPEPLPDPTEWIAGAAGGPGVDPVDRITLDESVTMAFLVVFESMTPAERVAFVLHDIFRYPFAEVAEIVGRSPAAYSGHGKCRDRPHGPATVVKVQRQPLKVRWHRTPAVRCRPNQGDRGRPRPRAATGAAPAGCRAAEAPASARTPEAPAAPPPVTTGCRGSCRTHTTHRGIRGTPARSSSREESHLPALTDNSLPLHGSCRSGRRINRAFCVGTRRQ
ncbi:sigma-70 family RNA polymerase sigma factor [Kitasatospora sp. NPDC001175]